MTKPPRPALVTPLGVASCPWLTTPDTRFNPTGEYRAGLILDEAEVQPFVENLEALRKDAHGEAVKANPKLTVKRADSPVKPALDSEKNPIPGKVVVTFKMKAKITNRTTGETMEQQPALFHANGQPPKGDELDRIGAGSLIQVSSDAVPYFMASTKEAGISLRLKAVRVVTLIEACAPRQDGAAYGFPVTP